MRLYLMRHGEAEAGLDYDTHRALTARGHENNLSVARLWRSRVAHTPIAFCSPYLRAKQTAADLQSVIPELKFSNSDWLLPSAAVNRVYKALSMICEKRGAEMAKLSSSLDVGGDEVPDILLVGHNPLLSHLWNDLLEGDGVQRLGLSTSHLVSIDTEVLAPACGSFVYTISP